MELKMLNVMPKAAKYTSPLIFTQTEPAASPIFKSPNWEEANLKEEFEMAERYPFPIV
jgi:hypothetical protein